MMMIMVESYILASVVFISVDNGKEVFKISQFMCFFCRLISVRLMLSLIRWLSYRESTSCILLVLVLLRFGLD